MQLSIATLIPALSAEGACITATQAAAAASRKTHAAQQRLQLQHISTGGCSILGKVAAAQLHMQLQHSKMCILQASIATQKLAGPASPQVTGAHSPCSWTPFAQDNAKALAGWWPHSMLAACSASPPHAGLVPPASQGAVH